MKKQREREARDRGEKNALRRLQRRLRQVKKFLHLRSPGVHGDPNRTYTAPHKSERGRKYRMIWHAGAVITCQYTGR